MLALLLVLPQRIHSEERNPLSLLLQKTYNPFFIFVMQYRWLTLGVAVGLMAATLWPLKQLGSEFMPPLEEGDLLYMPTTDPGIMVRAKAARPSHTQGRSAEWAGRTARSGRSESG